MGASSTDSRGWLAQHGADGFKRNIENHPWRRVGDARFDGLSKAIFQKVLEGDERAMNWDDDMQQVVGLWDQVIHGIHTLKSKKLRQRGYRRGPDGQEGPYEAVGYWQVV